MASEEWWTLRLGDVCTKIGSGATPRGGAAVYFSDGPFALIRSQNVHNGGFRHDGLVYIGPEHAQQLNGVEVREGDVLLNITGDSVARSCRVDPSVLPARVNQHVAIVRPDATRLDPLLLRYLLIEPATQLRLLSWAGAGATRNALTKGMIEALEFRVPRDMGEQHAIAEVLGALDDKIELNERMNATLDEMARALFKSWFMDFDPVRAKAEGRQPSHMDDATTALFPDSFEDSPVGPIPAGWRVGAVDEIVDVNPKRLLKKGAETTYVDMAALPTAGPEVTEWRLREFTSGSRFQQGDTLLARITPCLENGKTAFVDFLGPDEIGWGSTEFIVLRPKPPLPEAFAYTLARDDAFRQHAIANMTGSSGRQRVPPDAVAAYQLAIPTSGLGTAFGTLVQPWFDLMTANSREASTLAELRDTLIPKLISGEIRVREAAREVEAVV